MPVPSAITDLSQTEGSNSPAGSEAPTTADNYFRAHASFIAMLRDGKNFADPVTLASATTTDIGGQNSLCVEVSGTTTITSFGTTYNGPRFLRFTGALILTHNATTLNLPGSANVTTEAGDTCIVIPNSTPNGWNVVHYQRKDLVPGTADSATTATSATSATTATSATSATTATNLAAGGAGQIPYQSAAGTTAMLAAGNADEIVTSAGAAPPVWRKKITLGTSQATTSGTTKEFTSIPSWVTRITVMLNGVSTNGTSGISVQIGSGSYTTSGYSSYFTGPSAGVTTGGATQTAGFYSGYPSIAAGYSAKGTVILYKYSGNEWMAVSNISLEGSPTGFTLAVGNVTLGGTLDRVRITSDNGVDTFDAGAVNIMYE